ncbi:MAG: FecR family protein [Aliarcobacter sp.]|nr:FecR family protein [Aliarcobacter sp.]
MKKIIFVLLFISNFLFANNVGKIVSFNGEASILRENQTILVDKNSVFQKNDTLNTKENTKLQILFLDDTIISVGQNSTLKINDYLFEEKDSKAEFTMAKGVFRTITGKIGKVAPENFKLETKSASIGIRGTQIITAIEDNNEKIFCTEGQIEIKNNETKDSVIVNKGEFVSFKEGNKDKLNVQKIKQGDLQEINKSIAIKENLPIDNVSINTEDEKISSNQSPSSILNKTTSNETITVAKVEKAVINIPVKEQTSNNSSSSSSSSNSSSNSSTEDISGLNNESNFQSRTPASFFHDNTSTAKYIGSFPTEQSSSNYLVNLSGERVAIPSDTRISMNIDFGKANNQISNGKITVNDIGNGSNKVFTFEGDLNGSSGNLSLYPRGDTSGSTGSARLYGDTATYMKGDVDFKSSNNTEIKSEFSAKKQ